MADDLGSFRLRGVVEHVHHVPDLLMADASREVGLDLVPSLVHRMERERRDVEEVALGSPLDTQTPDPPYLRAAPAPVDLPDKVTGALAR